MKVGLSHNFNLKQGKFVLTGGQNKLKDSLFFLLLFDTIPRIYQADFAPKVMWLIQKPMSYVDTYKILLLGRLKKIVQKYVSDIKIDSIDIISNRSRGEKSYDLSVNYSYTGDEGESINDNAVKFI